MPAILLRQGGWEHLDLPAIAVEDRVIELGHRSTHHRRVGDVLHPEREDLVIMRRREFIG